MEHNLFKPKTFVEGQNAVVGDCNGISCEQRWKEETPVFAKAIIDNLPKIKNFTILDYGCGVGRLAKEVLTQAIPQTTLIGVDASSEMIKEAMTYVDNTRFYAVLPHQLDERITFDLVYCIYVLQHVPAIEIRDILERIHRQLSDDGVFVYCSSDYRMAVRYDNGGFFDDSFLGVNLREEISRFFTLVKPLFTSEELEQNPTVRKIVQEALPHPALIFKKKTITNYLKALPDKVQEVVAEKSVSTTSKDAHKLLLVNRLAPGDILVMTNALRDLHITYPKKFITDVNTPCNEIFENNPYVTKLQYDNDKFNQINSKFSAVNPNDVSVEARTAWLDDILVIDMQYPLIHQSGLRGAHFSEGHSEYLSDILDLEILKTDLRPELYFSQTERNWVNPLVVKKGINKPYWVINAGSKGDYTLKQYPYYQEVIDMLKERITFVQIGQTSHQHKPLNNVIDMVGQTNMRELFRLIFAAQGVITCVSLPMHIAAAFSKPCVVVAGAREGTRWELYPNQQFLYVNGCLPCAPYDGCWKSKQEDCNNKVEDVPRCMTLINPADVANSIERYYSGGILHY